MHHQREEYPLALNDLQMAIALDPEDARALCALGVGYHNMEDWLRAYKALTRAVELDPKNRVARPGKTTIEEEFGLSGGS